jgi:hypothetical protein
MLVTTVLAQVEEHRELPFEPIVFGIVVLGGLLALLVGLLMFGKGRPHA